MTIHDYDTPVNDCKMTMNDLQVELTDTKADELMQIFVMNHQLLSPSYVSRVTASAA